MVSNMDRILKQTFFYVAFLAFLLISGHAFSEGRLPGSLPQRDGARERLAHGQRLLAEHDYEGAIRECRMVVSMSKGKSPGDEALLCLGQIFSDPQNPRKDLSVSIASFEKLTKEYSQSMWANLARVLMANLKEQGRLKQAMRKSSQENERLKRLFNDSAQENARLKKIVEESKAVDAAIEEKKKDQAK